MSNHLTPEQISRCLIGDGNEAEERHARQCVQCSAELADLRRTFSQFRTTVENWADQEGASNVPDLVLLDRAMNRGAMRRLRLLAAAAAIAIVAAIPVYRKSVEPKAPVESIQESTYDTELLERVNAHLSRTAPLSLEPLMTLTSAPGPLNNEGER